MIIDDDAAHYLKSHREVLFKSPPRGGDSLAHRLLRMLRRLVRKKIDVETLIA
jgi:hypothetical protein